MSLPSIEDEAYQYYVNEVEANCPTLADKAKMTYKVLMRSTGADEMLTAQRYAIIELIEHYIEHADVSEMVSIIADGVREGVEYE
jgi:hypothetical protein